MGAAMSEVTSGSFDTFIKGTKVAVVDFSASWCGPCQMLKPHVEALAAQYAGKVNIGKLDIDNAPDIATRFSVMSVPTILFFKDGKQADSLIGVVPKDAIDKKIKALM